MSTIRFDREGLVIATYAGPESYRSIIADTRTMIEITSNASIEPDQNFVNMTMDQWYDLVNFIRSLDDKGMKITDVPEVT